MACVCVCVSNALHHRLRTKGVQTRLSVLLANESITERGALATEEKDAGPDQSPQQCGGLITGKHTVTAERIGGGRW